MEARALLSGVLLMWTDLPSHLGHVRGASLDTDRPSAADGRPLPGGDALVLLGPGGTGTAEDGETSRDGDPVSVAWFLAQWEDEWRHTRGDGAAEIAAGSTSAVVFAAAHFLEQHARWAAAEHPAFPDFLGELKALHEALERASGMHRAAVRAPVPCFECGGALLRLVREGLEDEVLTCASCRTTLEPSEYQRGCDEAAKAASRLDVAGEAFETVALVAQLLERPAWTVRGWERRGLIRRHDQGGVIFVSVGDAVRQDELSGRRAS